jgi:hypothetical protein
METCEPRPMANQIASKLIYSTFRIGRSCSMRRFSFGIVSLRRCHFKFRYWLCHNALPNFCWFFDDCLPRHATSQRLSIIAAMDGDRAVEAVCSLARKSISKLARAKLINWVPSQDAFTELEDAAQWKAGRRCYEGSRVSAIPSRSLRLCVSSQFVKYPCVRFEAARRRLDTEARTAYPNANPNNNTIRSHISSNTT